MDKIGLINNILNQNYEKMKLFFLIIIFYSFFIIVNGMIINHKRINYVKIIFIFYNKNQSDREILDNIFLLFFLFQDFKKMS